jgi:hypothetical protein
MACVSSERQKRLTSKKVDYINKTYQLAFNTHG